MRLKRLCEIWCLAEVTLIGQTYTVLYNKKVTRVFSRLIVSDAYRFVNLSVQDGWCYSIMVLSS